MKPRWAIAVSIVGFFLITGVVFVYSPDNPYMSGSAILVRPSCHTVTAAELQSLNNFYQRPAPIYVRYFFWLGQGLLGQWQPQLPSCPVTVSLGSSVLYFEVGLVAWVVLTVAVIAYSLTSRRKGESTSPKQVLPTGQNQIQFPSAGSVDGPGYSLAARSEILLVW